MNAAMCMCAIAVDMCVCEHVCETMNATVCMCANVCAHVCEHVCECMNASFGVIYSSVCARLCVCTRMHMTPNHEKQAEKGEQRAVAREGPTAFPP